MKLTDTKEILKEIAAVDNRKLDADVLQVWHGYIGHLSYEVAKEALRLARLDDRVNWLEPKNLMTWVSQAGTNVGKATQVVPESGICEHKTDVEYCKICSAKLGRVAKVSPPQPKCREHDKILLACDPCCSKLNQYASQHGYEGLHQFALKNIYA